MVFLKVKDITVEYRRNEPVIHKFNLTVSKGEFISLLGPSGSGKTTLLRTIMGFLQPISGKILVQGKNFTNIPSYKRNFGIVFQSYALFPHLTVFENVAFGLRMRHLPSIEIKRRVGDALTMVSLEELEGRFPRQLSGGQAQRVALARALVIEPLLLLLDEPLSNLDAKLRENMRVELRKLQKELGVTTIYVTHDQLEALAFSDRIVLMNQERIEQIGTPKELFFEPINVFVADFMGLSNRFPAIIVSQNKQFVHFEATGHHLITSSYKGQTLSSKAEVALAIRPSSVQLFAIVREGEENILQGVVISKIFQGDRTVYILRTDLGELTALRSETQASFEEGESVFVKLKPEELVVLTERK